MMKRIVFLIALSTICAMTGSVRGEELGSQLRSGPALGKKIHEFRTERASQRHLCWSCFG